MDAKLALSTIFLHLLLLLATCNGSRLIETGSETPVNHGAHSHTDMRIEQLHSHSHESHSHMDPSLVVFFFVADLKTGNMIPIYFPNRKLNSSAHLIPKQEADSIPFSSRELAHLLRIFSFSQGSPQATAMEDTLRQCETKPITGETKTCATSWESMLDFTRSIFGSQAEIEVLSTKQITESNSAVLQKYRIMEIREVSAPKSVACHTMPYPYAVLYCHYQESESRVFRVLLTGENGDRVEAVAVCHMDTSQWSRKHVAFKVLGIEPGSSPVCHFFPADNFVCVPSTGLMKAKSLYDD